MRVYKYIYKQYVYIEMISSDEIFLCIFSVSSLFVKSNLFLRFFLLR